MATTENHLKPRQYYKKKKVTLTSCRVLTATWKERTLLHIVRKKIFNVGVANVETPPNEAAINLLFGGIPLLRKCTFETAC